MNIRNSVIAGLVIALLLLGFANGNLRHDNKDLRSAVSIASHATDKQGMPVTFSTKGAIEAVRILGNALDDIQRKVAAAGIADANHVITVERKDASASQEVSADVLAQLDRTEAALADSRALAAKRLRALAQARSDQGGGGNAPIAQDPDATCGAAFAATCDEVLALLAEAERNTAQLIGWQAFWPRVQANHDGTDALPPGDGVAQP